MEDARVGRHLVRCYRRLLNRAQHTTNKNGRISKERRAMIRSLCTLANRTPPKNGTNTKESYIGPSTNVLARQLGFSSNGAAYRNMKIGKEKRGQIADGNVDGWIMVEDEDPRNQLPDKLWKKLCQWISTNKYIHDNPFKGPEQEVCQRRRDSKYTD